MSALEKNIVHLYGEKGKQWLANLSEWTAQIARTYGLSHLKAVNNLSYNYVLSGLQSTQPIILKLGLDINGLKREGHALKIFSGLGVVHVLIENEGMLLLEQAVSGVSLKSYFPKKDDDAIRITCDCLKRLHQAPIPDNHGFPSISDWLMAMDGNVNIPMDYLNKARILRKALISTAAEPVFLHGDLHPDNILQNGDGWVVIDPKGVIGELSYDVAAFIRNPIPQLLAHSNALNIIKHRIACFSEILKISEQRILDWCYVQAVLAWIWALEDGCDESYFKKITAVFYSLRNK